MPHTFYRLVLSNPPTVMDFMSATALGRQPLPDDLELRRLANGVSVFATETQARQKARQYPWLGAYVSEVEIPYDGPISIEKTVGRGHHTLGGTREQLAACVVATRPLAG
ncbi:MAG: hypothetical protein ACYDAG_04560 [Chloroflexota bacterium]